MSVNIPSSRPVVPFGRIVTGGLITIVLAVIANLIALFIMKAILPISPDFPPTTPGPVIFLTAAFTAIAVVVYWIITRVSATPVRTWRIVGWIVLLLSIIPNVIGVINPTALPMPFPGATSLAFGALIVFHFIAGLICIYVLPRFARPEVRWS